MEVEGKCTRVKNEFDFSKWHDKERADRIRTVHMNSESEIREF